MFDLYCEGLITANSDSLETIRRIESGRQRVEREFKESKLNDLKNRKGYISPNCLSEYMRSN
ncbi:uncharacterized protein PRCAT00001413001 [Priceomyces carsonii]|uniref:uncharacterized protein n=1 Tax=Priceomyces carsonii TaxID=28549 RepID=UPI002ED9A236|nr:unnamed protein product [Priceomyces carsonii]